MNKIDLKNKQSIEVPVKINGVDDVLTINKNDTIWEFFKREYWVDYNGIQREALCQHYTRNSESKGRVEEEARAYLESHKLINRDAWNVEVVNKFRFGYEVDETDVDTDEAVKKEPKPYNLMRYGKLVEIPAQLVVKATKADGTQTLEIIFKYNQKIRYVKNIEYNIIPYVDTTVSKSDDTNYVLKMNDTPDAYSRDDNLANRSKLKTNIKFLARFTKMFAADNFEGAVDDLSGRVKVEGNVLCGYTDVEQTLGCSTMMLNFWNEKEQQKMGYIMVPHLQFKTIYNTYEKLVETPLEDLLEKDSLESLKGIVELEKGDVIKNYDGSYDLIVKYRIPENYVNAWNTREIKGEYRALFIGHRDLIPERAITDRNSWDTKDFIRIGYCYLRRNTKLTTDDLIRKYYNYWVISGIDPKDVLGEIIEYAWGNDADNNSNFRIKVQNESCFVDPITEFRQSSNYYLDDKYERKTLPKEKETYKQNLNCDDISSWKINLRGETSIPITDFNFVKGEGVLGYKVNTTSIAEIGNFDFKAPKNYIELYRQAYQNVRVRNLWKTGKNKKEFEILVDDPNSTGKIKEKYQLHYLAGNFRDGGLSVVISKAGVEPTPIDLEDIKNKIPNEIKLTVGETLKDVHILPQIQYECLGGGRIVNINLLDKKYDVAGNNTERVIITFDDGKTVEKDVTVKVADKKVSGEHNYINSLENREYDFGDVLMNEYCTNENSYLYVRQLKDVSLLKESYWEETGTVYPDLSKPGEIVQHLKITTLDNDFVYTIPVKFNVKEDVDFDSKKDSEDDYIKDKTKYWKSRAFDRNKTYVFKANNLITNTNNPEKDLEIDFDFSTLEGYVKHEFTCYSETIDSITTKWQPLIDSLGEKVYSRDVKSIRVYFDDTSEAYYENSKCQIMKNDNAFLNHTYLRVIPKDINVYTDSRPGEIETFSLIYPFTFMNERNEALNQITFADLSDYFEFKNEKTGKIYRTVEELEQAENVKFSMSIVGYFDITISKEITFKITGENYNYSKTIQILHYNGAAIQDYKYFTNVQLDDTDEPGRDLTIDDVINTKQFDGQYRLHYNLLRTGRINGKTPYYIIKITTDDDISATFIVGTYSRLSEGIEVKDIILTQHTVLGIPATEPKSEDIQKYFKNPLPKGDIVVENNDAYIKTAKGIKIKLPKFQSIKISDKIRDIESFYPLTQIRFFGLNQYDKIMADVSLKDKQKVFIDTIYTNQYAYDSGDTGYYNSVCTNSNFSTSQNQYVGHPRYTEYKVEPVNPMLEETMKKQQGLWYLIYNNVDGMENETMVKYWIPGTEVYIGVRGHTEKTFNVENRLGYVLNWKKTQELILKANNGSRIFKKGVVIPVNPDEIRDFVYNPARVVKEEIISYGNIRHTTQLPKHLQGIDKYVVDSDEKGNLKIKTIFKDSTSISPNNQLGMIPDCYAVDNLVEKLIVVDGVVQNGTEYTRDNSVDRSEIKFFLGSEAPNQEEINALKEKYPGLNIETKTPDEGKNYYVTFVVTDASTVKYGDVEISINGLTYKVVGEWFENNVKRLKHEDWKKLKIKIKDLSEYNEKEIISKFLKLNFGSDMPDNVKTPKITLGTQKEDLLRGYSRVELLVDGKRFDYFNFSCWYYIPEEWFLPEIEVKRGTYEEVANAEKLKPEYRSKVKWPTSITAKESGKIKEKVTLQMGSFDFGVVQELVVKISEKTPRMKTLEEGMTDYKSRTSSNTYYALQGGLTYNILEKGKTLEEQLVDLNKEKIEIHKQNSEALLDEYMRKFIGDDSWKTQEKYKKWVDDYRYYRNEFLISTGEWVDGENPNEVEVKVYRVKYNQETYAIEKISQITGIKMYQLQVSDYDINDVTERNPLPLRVKQFHEITPEMLIGEVKPENVELEFSRQGFIPEGEGSVDVSFVGRFTKYKYATRTVNYFTNVVDLKYVIEIRNAEGIKAYTPENLPKKLYVDVGDDVLFRFDEETYNANNDKMGYKVYSVFKNISEMKEKGMLEEKDTYKNYKIIYADAVKVLSKDCKFKMKFIDKTKVYFDIDVEAIEPDMMIERNK